MNIHEALNTLGYEIFATHDLSMELWAEIDPQDPDQTPHAQPSVALGYLISQFSLNSVLKTCPKVVDLLRNQDNSSDEEPLPCFIHLAECLLSQHPNDYLVVLVDKDFLDPEDENQAIDLIKVLNHPSTYFLLGQSPKKILQEFINTQSQNLHFYKQIQSSIPPSHLVH